MSMRIIFKFDDFTGVTKRVARLDRIVRFLKIKITWGIIGNSLDKWNDKEIAWVKKRADDGLYYFWNHGWTHAMGEFWGLSVAEAKEHLQKTQDAVKAKVGITLDVFGAPCNKISDSTLQAIDSQSEIKGWFYGDARSIKRVFKRELELEYPLFRPRIVPFIENFRRAVAESNNERIFVLQGHPNQWHTSQFFNFICIIIFLKLKKCKFDFPQMGRQYE